MASTRSGHNFQIIGKTRLCALSISEEQRLDPVIQEQQMTQEVTRVSLCICTNI